MRPINQSLFARAVMVLTSQLLVICLFSSSLLATMQDEIPSDTPAELVEILSELQQVLQESDYSEAEKTDLQNQLNAASTKLEECKSLQQQIESTQSEIETIELQSQNLDKELAELRQPDPVTPEPVEPGRDETQTELEDRLNRTQQELAKLRAGQLELEKKINSRIAQKDELQTRIEAAQQNRNQIEKQIEQASLQAQTLAGQIKNVADKAERLSLLLQEELFLLQQKRNAEEEKFGLLQKQSERLGLKINRLKESENRLIAALNSIRQAQARKAAEAAMESVADIEKENPVLAESEKITAGLATRLKELEDERVKAEKKSRGLRDRYIETRRQYEETIIRVEGIGLSSSVAAMLRRRQAALPDAAKCLFDARVARQRLEEIQAQVFDVEDQLTELNFDYIRDEIAAQSESVENIDWQKLQEPIQELIGRRKDQLRALKNKLLGLFDLLFEIEDENLRLAKLSRQFDQFIDEHILWARSNKLLLSEWSIDQSTVRLLSLSAWNEALTTIVQRFQRNAVWFTFGFLTLVALFLLKPTMRREVDRMGEMARRGSCATFWPTSRALFLTVLVAVTVPLFLVLVGITIRWGGPASQTLLAGLSTAFITAGTFLLPVEILRRICRTGGLASNHFYWPDDSVEKLRIQLNWFVLPATLIVFAISLLIGIESTHRIDLVDRVLFVLGMVLLGILLYRILSPENGIFARYLRRNENSWANQTSALWLGFILLIPISLAVLTISGYYFSALNLSQCLFWTFSMAVVIETIRAVVNRFVLVRRRFAHIEQSRRKREKELKLLKEARKKEAAEKKQRVSGSDSSTATETTSTTEATADLHVETVDIDENAGQANQLVNLIMLVVWFFSLWSVWDDVLPAAKGLDNFILWPNQMASVADNPTATAAPLVAMGPEGNPAANVSEEQSIEAAVSTNPAAGPIDSVSKVDPGVSLGDLLIFIAIAVITFVAARNLPNAVEMLFLEHLPVDQSARFATKALFSYALVMLGTILAMRVLSINWSNIQWLVTALTFGLAFGLQEIFANFVAGIILMFERPMRIGDVITVDEFTGTVTRIRTRATTIVNWDRKEYVIPNKDFITGRLINWTLSDAINRVQFTVGVAYGSDVERAKRIIFDICENHPHIIEDPATSITFEEFGDSSLNLVVRTFLGEIDNRLKVIDELHFQINQRFNEAGIEISFPQRDLHLRSYDPAFLELARDKYINTN